MRNKKGFTLVEILIVVVILGILAAIVIPQFTDASTQSKISSSLTSLQTLRSQVELYKIQHNDNPPVLATFETQMEDYSDVGGTTDTAKGTSISSGGNGIIYGPYVQEVPTNPWSGSDTVLGAPTADNGWVYIELTGDVFLDTSNLDATNDAEVITALTEAGAIYVPAAL